jgi:hypothetical protein
MIAEPATPAVLRARHHEPGSPGAEIGDRYTVHLQVGEVDRLNAVVVAGGEAECAFQAVDGQSGTPMPGVAAYSVDERRELRRVELQLEERRAGVGGIADRARVRVAVWRARILRV